MSAQPWLCAGCGTSELGQRENRAKYCRGCSRARTIFQTTQSNLRSGFNRTNKGSPSLEFSIDEFCKWRAAQELQCAYCGIAEEDLSRVGMRSQVQKIVKTMGVDRVASDLGYRLDNLVCCCFVCNQIKGDRFTAAEMRHIGPAVGRIWAGRLKNGVPPREYAAAVDQAAEEASGDVVEFRFNV